MNWKLKAQFSSFSFHSWKVFTVIVTTSWMINKISSIFRWEKAAFSLLYSVGKYILHAFYLHNHDTETLFVFRDVICGKVFARQKICFVVLWRDNHGGWREIVFFSKTPTQLCSYRQQTFSYTFRVANNNDKNGGWLSTSTFTFIWRHCENWLKKCSHENFIAMNLK